MFISSEIQFKLKQKRKAFEKQNVTKQTDEFNRSHLIKLFQ